MVLESEPRVTVCDDLKGADSAAWNALDVSSPFLSYNWLSARADTVAANFHTIQATDKEHLIAGAPCYLTNASSHPGYDPMRILEDAGTAVGPLAEQLRPSLVVAAPGRAGGVAMLRELDAEARERVLAAMIGAAEDFAAHERAPVVAWPYLAEGVDRGLQAVLRTHGYLSGVVDAQCYLPITWSSFEEYLAHFKASHRQTIRREREALARIGGRIEMGGSDLLGPELAELELHWRLKYGRTASLSGLLKQYARLRKHVGSIMRVFVAYLEETPIGFTVFVEKGRTWYARFGGFDYTVKDAFLYFNLLFYAPVQTAISVGIECIDYSLKSYDAKRSRGCLLRNVLLFLRVPPPHEAAIRTVLHRTDEGCRATFAAIAAAHGRADSSRVS